MIRAVYSLEKVWFSKNYIFFKFNIHTFFWISLINGPPVLKNDFLSSVTHILEY